MFRTWCAAQDFGRNFANDPTVKIPWVRPDLCGARVLVMEWIDGVRCTNPAGIQASGLDVSQFIRCGVVSGLRQLLEVLQACMLFYPYLTQTQSLSLSCNVSMQALQPTRPASRTSRPGLCCAVASAAALSLVLIGLALQHGLNSSH